MNLNRNTGIALLAGMVLGAGIVWIGFGRTTVLVPEDARLVELDRLGGPARLIPVSGADLAPSRPEMPKPPERRAETGFHNRSATELPREELAKVKFSASLANPGSDPVLRYQIYNGTDRVLTAAHVRVEGAREAGIPLGRSAHLSLALEPDCDWSEAQRLSGGSINSSAFEGLKIILVSAEAR